MGWTTWDEQEDWGGRIGSVLGNGLKIWYPLFLLFTVLIHGTRARANHPDTHAQHGSLLGLDPLRAWHTHTWIAHPFLLPWPICIFMCRIHFFRLLYWCLIADSPPAHENMLAPSKWLWESLLQIWEVLPCIQGAGHARPFHQHLIMSIRVESALEHLF